MPRIRIRRRSAADHRRFCCYSFAEGNSDEICTSPRARCPQPFRRVCAHQSSCSRIRRRQMGRRRRRGQHDYSFPLDISGKADEAQGAFINGDERVTSSRTSGEGLVVLDFDQYAESIRKPSRRRRIEGHHRRQVRPGSAQHVAVSGAAIRSSAESARGHRSLDMTACGKSK